MWLRVLAHVQQHHFLHPCQIQSLRHFCKGLFVQVVAFVLVIVLDPGVAEGLFCCETLVHILHNEALQELLGIWRVLRERLVIEMKVTLDDVADDLQL